MKVLPPLLALLVCGGISYYMITVVYKDSLLTSPTPQRKYMDNRSNLYSVWHSKSIDTAPVRDHKVIVVWTRIWRLQMAEIERELCPSMPECIITGNRSRVDEADAVVFHHDNLPRVYQLPRRYPHQHWVWLTRECPARPSRVNVLSYNGVFNWTMNYRHDSDVLANYGSTSLIYKRLKETGTSPKKDYTVGKTYLVVWFVSNCYKYLPRFAYAMELVKHISVDVFGKCGKAVCLGKRYNCSNEVIKQYKFYLSFESYNCKEYITEKFWDNAIGNEVVPVVLGTGRTDYEKFAPSGSFIHVDDFETPKALADYLKILDKDKERYNQYFRWRTQPPKSLYPEDYGSWCNLCRKLQQVRPTERKVYTDLDRWWAGENYDICKPIVQLDYRDRLNKARVHGWSSFQPVS